MAQECAKALARGFEKYNEDFRSITRRAQTHFEQRDWHGAHRDAVARIELYDAAVNKMAQDITTILGDRLQDRSLWSEIKSHYILEISTYLDNEFTKTFFSSITRRVFKTEGVDPAVEFVALDLDPIKRIKQPVKTRLYVNRGLRYLFDEMLADYAFNVPYKNIQNSIRYISGEVAAYAAKQHGGENTIRSIEIIKPVFYQNNRAYLVGKIKGDAWYTPLVIALKNSDAGILVDAVLMSESDVSMIFSFTRSYFHADLETVGDAVVFLRSLLPQKPINELYTVLGRAKQGKTERYREFFYHLEHSDDKFNFAPGEKGMVMLVFTLPSYDIVFKVIRDKFEYPKTITRQDVMDKYRLVFIHDRAGRLVDAQDFRQLKFNKSRFSPELLEELLTETSATARVEGDDLIVQHLYIERRLTPLNLYLRDEPEELAQKAILDYGQAIRDLAMSNIFPGDLLLKNFGVTRHGRVIFYDYDELCLLTDCNFRDLPQADSYEDEMRAEAWFYVGDNDVFPEQFSSFLGLDDKLLKLFLEVHGELFTAEYWRKIKERVLAGEVLHVVPYFRNPLTSIASSA